VLTLAELLTALAPTLKIEGAERVMLRGVCIDSRQAGADSLFVALHGERSDGHAYVQNAFAAGATVALVEQPIADVVMIDTVQNVMPVRLSLPIAVRVPHTLSALQHLSHARRMARPDMRVVAVTGSVGKTTTKEAIAAVLAQRFQTLKSVGNYNNEIGLPLTLMTLEPTHERAVLEMGMYDVGEIAALCRIALPQVGVVTNVGPVHLERLVTIERIAQAKAELIEALPADGIAVLNGDDGRVHDMRRRTAAPSITFGLHANNTVWADSIVSQGLEGTRFVAHIAPDAGLKQPSTCTLKLATLGEHMVMVALPAIAVGLIEGLSWEEIQQGLLAQGRGLRLLPKRGLRDTTLLDDSYNASPASALAALNVLHGFPGRHLAALGDMLELGAYEEEGHREVGRRCAQTVDVLVAVGARARFIADGAQEAGLPASAIHRMADNTEAIAFLRDSLQAGDTLLVKGSRGMGMEAIVNAFVEPNV
jgi:UDP-N-acetylmuramoyl-tripeptide--D-alanyl-D-alanine ligase